MNNTKQLLLLTVLLYTSTSFNAEIPKKLYTNIVALPTTAYKATKHYYDKAINSQYFQWLAPSAIAATVLYCDYTSYRDYQEFKSMPQKDRIEAIKIFTEFIIKTTLFGRQSYNPDALLYDYDYGSHGLPTELQRGYYDIIRGDTSFILTENQMKAFRLLAGLPCKAIIGLVGSLAFAYYANNKYC